MVSFRILKVGIFPSSFIVLIGLMFYMDCGMFWISCFPPAANLHYIFNMIVFISFRSSFASDFTSIYHLELKYHIMYYNIIAFVNWTKLLLYFVIYWFWVKLCSMGFLNFSTLRFWKIEQFEYYIFPPAPIAFLVPQNMTYWQKLLLLVSKVVVAYAY